MKTPIIVVLFACLLTPLYSQTILEWAVSETSPTPDVDDTAELRGTLDIPILGDGMTSGTTNSTALMGRFAPVILANPNDSISISYEILAMDGASGSGINSGLRWGVFNSNGTTFGGDEVNLSGWSGALAWNSGGTTNDADIRVRHLSSPNRFYIATDTTDVTGNADYANQDFDANGVIYTVTMTITRLAGDVMDISTTLTGGNGYSLTMSGQETTDAEFTFDRVGFWVNNLSASQLALRSSSAPTSTDDDSIPDLEEVRWFTNLSTADDVSNFDGDTLSDLHEITVSFTNPTDADDPPAALSNLVVDFNSDGTAGQTGPNLETGYVAYTAPHESNAIDSPAGINFPVFGSTVNLAVDYSDDNAFNSYPATVKQMIGRSNSEAALYDGALSELMRDWIGIDSRTLAGGNGPLGNPSSSPTNLTFTLSGIPAGNYEYHAYHHDVAGIQGKFELTITDANRTSVSLGNFQMTASAPAHGNPVYDASGNKGTAGIDASTLTYAGGQAPPSGAETRTLLAANIGQITVSTGILKVFLDDFPALNTGTSNDRTWLQGIGYRLAAGSEITYVDITLLNTDIISGGSDSLWADGDDGSTGGTIIDGSAISDGLWRFRSTQGNDGIWEASGSSAAVEDCVEIATSVVAPNATYDVFVFYYPVSVSGDYPVRAGFTSGTPLPDTNPGAGNPPSALASTVTVPFESNAAPVIFTYRVYETPADESLSVVGVNGFEISERITDFRVTAISKSGNTITLTWISHPGKTYDIKAGTNLQAFATPVVENISSQGATTTRIFQLPVGLATEPAVFLVVEQKP